MWIPYGLMDVPQPKFESLFFVVLLYNQGYLYKFSANMNTIDKIWIDKRIV